jgi:hypothetical protein
LAPPDAILVVNRVPSSQNARQRMHWRVRSAEDQVLQVYVQQAWVKAGRPRAQGRVCRIETTVHLYGRADDEDNRLARLKPVFDKLISLGALVDDSPAWCRHLVPYRVSAPKGKGFLEIALRYAERW